MTNNSPVVLYIDDEDALRELVQIALEADVGCSIVCVSSVKEAIEKIEKENFRPSVVLCDYKMPNHKGSEFYSYLRKTSTLADIPFFLITGGMHEALRDSLFADARKDSLFKLFEKPINFAMLSDSIKEVMPKEHKDNFTVIEYVPTTIQSLLKFSHAVSEIFIQLSKEKFVKLVLKGDPIDHASLRRYQMMGSNVLFVPKNDFNNFFESYQKLLDEKISVNEDDQLDSIVVQEEIVSFVQDTIKNLGINEQTIDLIGKEVDSVVKTLKTNLALDDLLKNITSKYGFISAHSLMISYIAGAMAIDLGWNSGNSFTKIGFAAILHDATLEKDEYAKIRTTNDPEFLKLPKKEQEKILKHPTEVFSYIKDPKALLPDVDHIIMCHHEMPDGSGFPRGINHTQISQVAAVFIVAEHFVVELMESGMDYSKVKRIIDTLRPDFEKGVFKKAFAALENSLFLKLQGKI